jgi:hypothetical protein
MNAFQKTHTNRYKTLDDGASSKELTYNYMHALDHAAVIISRIEYDMYIDRKNTSEKV